MFQGQYGANRRTDGKEGTEIWFSIPLISNEVDRDQFVMDDDAIQINPATNTMKLLNTKKFAFDKHFSGPQNRSKVKTSQKVIFSYFEMIERSTFLISFAFSYPFSSSVTFFFCFCTGLSSCKRNIHCEVVVLRFYDQNVRNPIPPSSHKKQGHRQILKRMASSVRSHRSY